MPRWLCGLGGGASTRRGTDTAVAAREMATRVLVFEPHPELRGFLARSVEHLGYRQVFAEGDGAGLPGCDVLLVDAGSEDGLALARALRRESPLLPVVCTGVYPPGTEALALEPVAFLVKPFTLAELESALVDAAALVPARLA